MTHLEVLYESMSKKFASWTFLGIAMIKIPHSHGKLCLCSVVALITIFGTVTRGLVLITHHFEFWELLSHIPVLRPMTWFCSRLSSFHRSNLFNVIVLVESNANWATLPDCTLTPNQIFWWIFAQLYNNPIKGFTQGRCSCCCWLDR